MTETMAPGKEHPILPALDAGITVCEVSNFRRASSVGISMASTDDGAHHACPKQDNCSGKALYAPGQRIFVHLHLYNEVSSGIHAHTSAVPE